jgi:hypothetical protein
MDNRTARTRNERNRESDGNNSLHSRRNSENPAYLMHRRDIANGSQHSRRNVTPSPATFNLGKSCLISKAPSKNDRSETGLTIPIDQHSNNRHQLNKTCNSPSENLIHNSTNPFLQDIRSSQRQQIPKVLLEGEHY